MTKKYNREEREIYLELWRESGLSGSQFCRENNIRPTTFYSWNKMEREKQKDDQSEIVKLTNLQINVPESNRIILENRGWKITLPPGFNRNDASIAMKLVESRNVS